MSSPNSCQTAHSSLAATKALHQEFASAYALAIKTRDPADVERARELKMSIDAAVLEFAEANKTLTVPRLVPGIFANWPSFLETLKIAELNIEFTRESIEIGGKDEDELLDMLKNGGFELSKDAEVMMKSDDFKRSLRIPNPNEPDYMKWQLKSREEAGLIRLFVVDLGFSNNTTMAKIQARAKELGLELCQPEVGPQLRLQYTNQPVGECVYVGMGQVVDRDGDPFVLSIENSNGDLWLGDDWATTDNGWDLGGQFMFRLTSRP